MSAQLISARSQYTSGLPSAQAQSARSVSLKGHDENAASFSQALQTLFAGAGASSCGVQTKERILSGRDFAPAASENAQVRSFAVLEEPTSHSDFTLLERNPAAASDFSVLDALSDGLMFASKIAGAVLGF